ncbi:MAG TPA: DUF2877 domain-containing protein [Chloroflexota bacterium]|nr:DUF2877 domain-containing protein [Chloroflexota bacterium]
MTLPARRAAPAASTIAALSKDSEFLASVELGRWGGEVVAVHARALTVRGENGGLWSMVAPEHGDAPATLVVALPPETDFRALGLRSGDRILWSEPTGRSVSRQPAGRTEPALSSPRSRAGAAIARPVVGATLVVGTALRVDLGAASLWRPALRPRSARPGAWRRLAAEMAGREARNGLAPLALHVGALLAGDAPPADLDALGARAWPALVALAAAWRALDVPATRAAVRGLAGLGPGLTPAADDLLVGLMAAYRWGRAAALSAAELALLDACTSACQGRTTALSLARLHYAACGLLDARSEAVLVALWQDDSAALRAAVDGAWAVGHSSGADTLTGLVMGLVLVEPGASPQGESARIR